MGVYSQWEEEYGREQYLKDEMRYEAQREREAAPPSTPCCNGIWTETPCPRPATWRGPQDSLLTLTRQWRACDEHRMPSDEPLADHPESKEEGGDGIDY